MAQSKWNIDLTHSGVNFTIRHMVVSKVRGRFTKFNGVLNLDEEDLTRSVVEATIDAGVPVARHTHPGVESAYVLEGGFELPIQGQATRTIKAGDGFQIPPDTPHAGGKPGSAKSVILITYVVEKGKPLASPA